MLTETCSRRQENELMDGMTIDFIMSDINPPWDAFKLLEPAKLNWPGGRMCPFTLHTPHYYSLRIEKMTLYCSTRFPEVVLNNYCTHQKDFSVMFSIIFSKHVSTLWTDIKSKMCLKILSFEFFLLLWWAGCQALGYYGLFCSSTNSVIWRL